MRRGLRLFVVMVALTASGSVAALGQHSAPTNRQNPNPASNPAQSMLQGQDRDQPIQIEAATLEVRDKKKMATFSGNVEVVQGATTMKCRSLVVFYGPEEGAGARKSAARETAPIKASGSQEAPNQVAGMPQNAQNIRRIEARGGVTVVTKDQNASGELGVYDLKTKLITLTGNVVVTQGKNVLHGERVVVDMTTGNARVESGGTTPTRVRALILPNKGTKGNSGNVMSFGPSRSN